jgi:hypothetical protein
MTEQGVLDNIKGAIVAWLAVHGDNTMTLSTKSQTRDIEIVPVGVL